MPVERCQRGGRAGYRWGASGFCYLGPDARAKAARQGRAIEAARRARTDAATTGRALAALRRQLGVDPKVEARYVRRLSARVKRLHRTIVEAIDARLQRLGEGIDDRARAAGRRVDARRRDTAASDLDELRGVLRVTERAWLRDNPIRDDVALDVGRAVERSATESTARAVERIARTRIEVPGPEGTDRALAAFARQNVDLIKTIDRRHFADVERTVVDALTTGRRTRDLRRDIAARFGVSERRAQLIARDQLASLNTQITRARQEDLGIARYRWTTSGDDRVREEHEAIDGEVFTWAEGHPEEGHPGEPINCRCVAVPVFEAGDITAGLVEEAEAREAAEQRAAAERAAAEAEATRAAEGPVRMATLDEWAESLEGQEKIAIRQWGSGMDSRMRAVDQGAEDRIAAKRLRALKQALSRAPVAENVSASTPLYRGLNVSREVAEALATADEIAPLALQSWSRSEKIGVNFTKGEGDSFVLFELRSTTLGVDIGRGVPQLLRFAEEEEVLITKNARYRVVSRTPTTSRWGTRGWRVVLEEAEVIRQDADDPPPLLVGVAGDIATEDVEEIAKRTRRFVSNDVDWKVVGAE